jgi:nucleoside phosphorylase
MKAGEDRDDIAKENGAIAFEMEGAAVWDEVPCIVVKGICDYADSHKNKRWQNFAAATAAAAMKAILELSTQTDKFPTSN